MYLAIVTYLALHFAICVAVFALLQRPAFLLYNGGSAKPKVGTREYLDTLRHGLRTDLIAAAYLTALPLLVIWAYIHAPVFSLRTALLIVEAVVAAIIALVSVFDTALYRFWQFKIEASVLGYLRSPKDAMASVSALYALTVIALVIIVFAGVYAILWLLIDLCGVAAMGGASGLSHLWGALLMLLIVALLFAAIRGVAHRPNTPTNVYYSDRMLLNHTALNPLYSFIYSLSVSEKYKGRFRFTDPEECAAEAAALYPREGTPLKQLLRTSRPNILLIVWESLSAVYFEPLDGRPEVTPRLSALAREGVLFSRVAAGATRTDPALVTILSGLPGQPDTSVIKNTAKLPALPALPRSLREAGYTTYALHGGNLNYMHFIDYFMASGHSKITGRDDLPADAPSFSWGVHDAYTFNRLYGEIIDRHNRGEQWFNTFLTLSSHEPFTVPYKRLDNPVHNAFAYTDEVLGNFIDHLKDTSAWDNLLIIVTGDHGINNVWEPLPHQRQSHIPLLMLGGAIKGPEVIDTLMSQSDLAATLLGQLGIDHADFPFSRDVLADTYTRPFSMHCYNNGFVVTDPRGFTDYDNIAHAPVAGDDNEREHIGRITLQQMYTHLDSL